MTMADNTTGRQKAGDDRVSALRASFEALEGDIRAHRRALHRIPELGFAETKTAGYVRGVLDGLGIRYVSGIGGTGIVATLGSGMPRVALRADMDALPITETDGRDYASIHEGVMHACGHDAHTAMLLGAAQYLKSVEAELVGEILLVFQPAEERSDGHGKSGARYIIDSGRLERVSAMFGLHVNPDAPAGRFGIISGPITASGDMFKATIRGKGGHDALVHRSVDPIYLATQVLNAIYAIRSRKIDPMAAGTLSVGTIEAGTTANVIPESASITGTVRTFDSGIRDIFVAELERALKVAEALGGSYELEIPIHVPETRNDPELAERAACACHELFGPEGAYDQKPFMGVEDFSWYSSVHPSMFIMMGARIEDGVSRPLHNSLFDIDDGVLYRGSALMAMLALRTLTGGESTDGKGN
jgi:amidohydrolase